MIKPPSMTDQLLADLRALNQLFSDEGAWTKGDRALVKAAEDVYYAWKRGEAPAPEGIVEPAP